MKLIALHLFLGFALSLLVGCATPGRGVQVPSDEQGIASPGVDIIEYELVVEQLVSSMLKTDLRTTSGKKPVIALGIIRNNTPFNIEVRMIGEDIRTEVFRSKLADFSTAVDFERVGGESGDLYKQLDFQNNSGHVDPATAKKFGKIIGADYVLFGNIYHFERKKDGVTETNFKFNLTMTDLSTGLVVWTDTKLVRKMMR